MKFYTIALIFCIFFSLTAFTQENKRTNLETELSVLISQGELRKAESVAEEIVKLEKSTNGEYSAPYANALFNYTVLLSRSLQANDQRISVSSKEKYEETIKKREIIGKNFRNLLSLYEKKLNDPLWLAKTQAEFGTYLYLNCQGTRNYLECVAESVALLGRAADIYEKRPESAKDLVSTLSAIASIYWSRANFEAFVPAYERYVSVVEKFGMPNELRGIYARFLETTGSNDEAAAEWKLYLVRYGKKEDVLLPHDNLLPRVESTIRFFGKMQGPPSRPVEPEKSVVNDAIQRSKLDNTVRFEGAVPSPNMLKATVVIDERGKVMDVKIESVADNAAAKIKEWVSKWKFRPYAQNGIPKKFTGQIEIPIP